MPKREEEKEPRIGEPLVSRAGESVIVSVPVEDGASVFRFDTPVYAKNDLEVTLHCTVIIPGLTSRVFESRLNVYSNSSKESYTRQLSAAFGKTIPWVLVLSQACSTFAETFKKMQDEEKVYADQIEAVPTVDLIEPFLEENSPNILFGKGGSGKTWLALRMMMSLASGSDFLRERPAKTVKSLFIDYENSKETFRERINMMEPYVPGFLPEHRKNLAYLSPKGTPLHDLKDTIQRIIKEDGFGLIVLDSAALACGGAPEDAQVAIRYFNALSTLKVTTLTIAHETKAENGNYVFGSVFFHNSARNIWNVKVDREQEEDVIHAGLLHRKCNNGRLRSPRAARIWFGPTGVDINWESPDRFQDEMGTKGRIIALLREGPKDLTSLCKEMDGVDRTTIKSRLTDLRKNGRVENNDGNWSIKSDEKRDEKPVTPPPVTGTQKTEEIPW